VVEPEAADETNGTGQGQGEEDEYDPAKVAGQQVQEEEEEPTDSGETDAFRTVYLDWIGVLPGESS